MLRSSPLVAFAATTNAANATAFYRDTLGLRVVTDEPFAIVFDASGTTLRIQKVEGVSKTPYTVLGWQVDDIANTADGLIKAGVDLVKYPHLQQDERGIATFPGGTQVAWFHDPDGNLLSVTQPA